MLQMMRSGALSGFFMVLLVLGAAGLVLTDSSGMLTSGITATDVAKAGDETIPYVPFDRQVRNMLRGQNISPEDAYKLGYVESILQAKTRELVLTQTANEYGVRASDEQVLKSIETLLDRVVPEGADKKQYLDTVLYQQGISKGELIDSTKRELTISLLQKALLANANFSPRPLLEDLYQFQNETRDIKTLIIKDEDVKLEKEATTERLEKYFNSHKNNYAIPEQRQITLGYFLPESLEQEAEITDEDIKAYYEDNLDAYAITEQRKLEQALLGSQEDALKLIDALKSDKSMKKSITNITGSHDGYLGEDLFEKEALIEGLAEPVFVANKGDIIGPHESAIGWHVIKINDIIADHTRPFSDVKQSIKDEMTHEAFAEQLIDIANDIDDSIAAGETLEEIKESARVPLEIVVTKPVTRFGKTLDDEQIFDIAELNADKPFILETAFELESGENSSTIELANGGFLVVRNDKTIEKHFPEFTDIQEQLKTDWETGEKHIQNIIKGQQTALKVKNGDLSLEDAAKELGGKIESLKAIKRNDDLSEKGLTGPAVTQIFTTKVGESSFSVMDSSVSISVIETSKLPELTNIKDEDLEALHPALHKNLQNEMNASLYQEFVKKYPVTINRPLLDQLYGGNREDL